ncbi:MAG: hypothetical protein GXP28_03730 [Planctomycetes bacterium]|nr:hypothetical protein [Planctomycetota bacterium]
MARPTRIDRATSPGRTLGRRPIVLARLPFVGSVDARVESRASRVESQEAAPLATLLPASSLESESLQEEPEKHSRSGRRRKRVSKSRESRPTKTFPPQGQSTGLSATLFTLHSQLAPFAGAIVALALIASAGLLYWMMVSPGRMPTDFRDAGREGFEASTAGLPKFIPHLPSFASRTDAATTTGVPETAAWEMPRWDSGEGEAEELPSPLEETSATQLQEEELVVTLEEPAAELPTQSVSVNPPEQTARPVGGPAFPTTNRPTALDFAKLGAGVKTQ